MLTEVLELQSAHRLLLALFDAGTAADAAVGVQLRFGHTHNAEVVHAHLATVIGAAGDSNLKMQVIGEHRLLDPFCKSGGIVASIGANPVADASGDIPGACGGIAFILGFLVDLQAFDDALQCLVNRIHLVKGNAGDLKALATGDVYGAVAVFLCDMLQYTQIFGLQMTAGYTNTGSSKPPFLGNAEGVFL